MEYGYSILMGIFSAAILVYAGLMALTKDYRSAYWHMIVFPIRFALIFMVLVISNMKQVSSYFHLWVLCFYTPWRK